MGAVHGGVEDAGEAFNCPAAQWQRNGELSTILAEAGVTRVVTPYLTTGWTRDALWPELAAMEQSGSLTQLLPDLQRLTWPHARAGFFRVKKEIDTVLGDIGLAAG